jgi:hypothetical protein
VSGATAAPALPARPTPAPPTAAEAGRLAALARDRIVLPLVWLASAAWMLVYLRRGWVPHDEGTLAQSAERVLRGELPHRDFVDLYTGGLSYLNALSFRVFGETLLSPRIVLFFFALLWIPALYFVARRFARPVGAGALTLLALAWSLPNYMAALPSWYNLVFATFGLAALLQGLSTRRAGWLAAAGACGGISVLFKLPGVYFIAGALLALAYAEQCDAEASADLPAAAGAPGGAWLYRAFLAVCAAAAIAAAVLLVRSGGATAEFHFALPVAALSTLLLWNERALRGPSSGRRFRALFGRALPFLAGAAVPLLLFAVPFAAAGALRPLLRGVFVLPMLRIAHASAPAPAVVSMLFTAALPVLALAIPARALRPAVLAVVAVGLAALLAASGSVADVYAHVFVTARAAIPVAAVAGAVALARSRTAAGPARRRDVYAVLAVAALCALVQFPFSAPVYFCYVAPLAVLAAAAALSLRAGPPPPLHALLLAFYLVFAALWVNRGFIFQMGSAYEPDSQTEVLRLPRAGGIRIPPAHAYSYRVLVEELHRHTRGPYIYAGPDAPEVYFLAGYRNPTPQLFEFFDLRPDREAQLLATLERAGVQAIAINQFPAFSPLPSTPTANELGRRYHHAVEIGKFILAWREPGDPPATPAGPPAAAAPR